jgi:hypothetical protein
MIPVAQHLLLLYILINTGVVAYILSHATIDRSRSISLHVADARASFLLFAIASTLASGVFALYLFYWFIPALQLTAWFTVTVVLAMLCQLIAAWIPQILGWKEKAHLFFAYAMAFFMPVALLLLLASPVLSATTKALTVLLVAWMVSSLIRYRVQESVRAQYLIYQSVYIGCFCSALLAATYIR